MLVKKRLLMVRKERLFSSEPLLGKYKVLIDDEIIEIDINDSKNKLLNYSNAYIYQDTEYFKMSLDSLLLAKFVTINMRDKNIIDLATGNAPIPMLLTYRTKAHICGVEIQEEVYNLANLSIKKNKNDAAN